MICVVAGALLIGVVAGTFIKPPNTTLQTAISLPTSAESDESDDALYQDSLQAKNTEIIELTKQVEALQLDLDQANQSATLAPPETPAEDAIEQANLEESEPEEEADPRRRRRQPDDEESRAQREEFVDRMRNGMLDRWDREWETATPESKERITAIANYEQELMDIRGGIRSAQTDEERSIIIEEMSTTREAMNQTMKDEQNAQLSNLAVKYGVSDPEKIDQFVLDTQKTLNSPIFQGGRGGGGGFSFGGPEVEVSAGQR
jgi:hypothetical protein